MDAVPCWRRDMAYFEEDPERLDDLLKAVCFSFRCQLSISQ